MDSHALAGSRSTICHADSHTHRGPRDTATWDKTMRPQSADHLPGIGRRPGGCGRRGWGGKGRAGERRAPRLLPRPELHPRPQSLVLWGPESGAELARPQPFSKDAILERPPCPAPPGRLEDQPRSRPSGEGAAPSRGASRKFGLRERVREAGRHLRGLSAPIAGTGREDQAASPGP